MDSAESWRTLFESWPDTLPREGLLMTPFQETMPCVSFRISGGILLVQRDQPDTHGARKVMISYDAILAVKLTSPDELARYQVLGFQAPL